MIQESEAQSLSTKPESFTEPAWRHVKTYILLIPMVFFATTGHLFSKNLQVDTNAFGLTASSPMQSGPVQTAFWVITACIISLSFFKAVRAVMGHTSLFVFVIWAIASIGWSSSPLDTVRRVILLAGTVVFGAYFHEEFSESEQMGILLVTVWIVAILSFITVFVAPSYGLGYSGEWKGIFGHKNDLGMYMVMLTSPLFFVRAHSVLGRLGAVILFVMSLILIGMSQSRSGWLLLATYVVFNLYANLSLKLKIKDAFTLSSLFMGAAVGTIWIVLANASTVARALGKTSDLTGRTVIWQAVLVAISKHSIAGYGYGGFWNGTSGESANTSLSVGFVLGHAHNGILNLWVDLGAVGCLLFLWTFVVAIRDVITCLRADHSNPILWWYILMFVLFVQSNIDESLIMQYNSIYTILYVMLILGLRRLSKQGSVQSVPASGQHEAVEVAG